MTRPVLALALAVACGDPASPRTAPRIGPTFYIVASSRTVTIPRTLQLGVSSGDGTVSWESNRPDIASVSALGVVTAHFPGTASITAHRSGVSAMLVLAATPGSVEVEPSAPVLASYGSQLLTVTVRDADGAVLADTPVEWESNDKGIATVDDTGLVSARSPGAATITASSGDARGAVVVTVGAPAPVPSAGLAFSSVGTVGNYGCGIEAATRLAYCWGDNHSGALGVGDAITPYDAPVLVDGGARRFSSIAVGYYSSCGLEAETGFAYCWGRNDAGQLGDGSVAAISAARPTLVARGALRFSSVAASGDHSCGIEVGTELAYCWGAGGSIGDGTLARRPLPTAVGTADEARRFSSVSVGGGITCGIESQTALAYCWGHNADGALGDGTTIDRLLPTLVGDGRIRFGSTSTSDGVTCGLALGTGVAYCWGSNAYGQIGDGTTTDRRLPTAVADGSPHFSSIDAGAGMVCGVEAGTGAGYCWGHNRAGSLGDGTTTDRLVPTLVGGGRPRFTQISAGGAGGGYEACGVEVGTGIAYCWGHSRLVPTAIWPPTAEGAPQGSR